MSKASSPDKHTQYSQLKTSTSKLLCHFYQLHTFSGPIRQKRFYLIKNLHIQNITSTFNLLFRPQKFKFSPK